MDDLYKQAPDGMKTKKETMIENDQLESMECTFKSETEEKWMFIVKKKNRDNVVRFLESKMKELFAVTTNITAIGAKARKTEQTLKALGSYADVLRGFANPQDDNLSAGDETPREMMTNPYQGRKRQYIAVETRTNGLNEQISEVAESEKMISRR